MDVLLLLLILKVFPVFETVLKPWLFDKVLVKLFFSVSFLLLKRFSWLLIVETYKVDSIILELFNSSSFSILSTKFWYKINFFFFSLKSTNLTFLNCDRRKQSNYKHCLIISRMTGSPSMSSFAYFIHSTMTSLYVYYYIYNLSRDLNFL